MFNLACCYQKSGKNELALEYFESLLETKKDWSDAYYGATLSAFKLGFYQKALDFSTEAFQLPWMKDIKQDLGRHFLFMQKKERGKKDLEYTHDLNTSTQQHLGKPVNEIRKDSKVAFIYLKALCEKKLLKFEEANESYKFISGICKRKKNTKLVRVLIGLLLASCNKSSTLTMTCLDQLLASFEELKQEKASQPSFLEYFQAGEGWRTDYHEQALFYLLKRRFFCRFTKFHLR